MHTYKGFLMAFIILIPPQGGYWAPSPLLPVHSVFSEQQFTQEPSIISSRAEQHHQLQKEQEADQESQITLPPRGIWRRADERAA